MTWNLSWPRMTGTAKYHREGSRVSFPCHHWLLVQSCPCPTSLAPSCSIPTPPMSSCPVLTTPSHAPPLFDPVDKLLAATNHPNHATGLVMRSLALDVLCGNDLTPPELAHCGNGTNNTINARQQTNSMVPSSSHPAPADEL